MSCGRIGPRSEDADEAFERRRYAFDDDVALGGPRDIEQVELSKAYETKCRATKVDLLHFVGRKALATKRVPVEQDLVERSLERASFEDAALKVDLRELGVGEGAVCERLRGVSSASQVGTEKSTWRNAFNVPSGAWPPSAASRRSARRKVVPDTLVPQRRQSRHRAPSKTQSSIVTWSNRSDSSFDFEKSMLFQRPVRTVRTFPSCATRDAVRSNPIWRTTVGGGASSPPRS